MTEKVTKMKQYRKERQRKSKGEEWGEEKKTA